MSPLVGNTPHHVVNSEDLVHKLKNLKLDPSEKLVSYDVKSLFTSIPVESAIEAVKIKCREDKHVSELTSSQLLELLRLCLSSTYCVY